MAPRRPLSQVPRGENLQVHDDAVNAIQKVHLEADRRSKGPEDTRTNAE
jgi:hypothetical protein